MASSFLFGEPVETLPDGERNYALYLVTNRHVVDDEDAIVLRFSSDDATHAPTLDVPLLDATGKRIYIVHPNPAIDVAVFPVNLAVLRLPGTRFSFFQGDQHVLDRAGMKAAGISEGDGVFVLGFPMGQVGGPRNYVIVRGGTLARVRDCLASAADEFLVDASVYPGNSGGPVVLRPELAAIAGTNSTAKAGLIGIVTGYVPYQDYAVSRQTGQVRVVFTENSGLAAVVPMDFVRETILLHRASLAPTEPTITTSDEQTPEGGPEITGSQPPPESDVDAPGGPAA